MSEPRRFIQVVVGPRQVGKTTAVQQFLEKWHGQAHYASADLTAPPQQDWIAMQWQRARMLANRNKPVVLVLDEIQKVARWSDAIKAFWEEDTRNQLDFRVILLGSSALLMHAGLTESLAGRFEQIIMSHWLFAECRQAFGWDLETYIYFGGYPGAAPFIKDEDRFSQYVRDALIETTLSKDVFLMHRIEKPALLRQLFQLAVEYSGQILSYQKMLGQLHDAGNTTTLAHYQHLLESAFLLRGLPKWHKLLIRKRASSPKWLILNTAIVSSLWGEAYQTLRNDFSRWGRLVETAVGAHLINSTLGSPIQVFYWRDRQFEVDFVLQKGERLIPIEVKSGARLRKYAGIQAFKRQFPGSKSLVVGVDGVPLEEFFMMPAGQWFSQLF
ncbi:ATP-binding protein [Thermodesulfatator atlanticus]